MIKICIIIRPFPYHFLGRWKQKENSINTHKSAKILDQLDSDSDYNSTTDEEGTGFRFGANEDGIEKGIEYTPPKKKMVFFLTT